MEQSLEKQMRIIRRRAVDIITEEDLEAKVTRAIETGVPLKVKLGLDPNRPDIHIGHMVVIDKLPFAAPDDPVIEARSDALRREGGNPFTQLFLPRAVIALKQGAGRLIRDVNDRGALVICDPRIRTRGYGRVFRASLPPMGRADDRQQLEDFLETLND